MAKDDNKVRENRRQSKTRQKEFDDKTTRINAQSNDSSMLRWQRQVQEERGKRLIYKNYENDTQRQQRPLQVSFAYGAVTAVK